MWDRFVISFCVIMLIELMAATLWAQLPAPVPVTLGAGAQIVIKLIDQAPAILTAGAALVASIVGLLNFRRLGKVQAQTNGHMTAMLAKQNELADKLAVSVPASSLEAVAAASEATAKAAATSRVAERASDRAADRASDRASDRAAAVLVQDRRVDAVPIKVDIVSLPEDSIQKKKKD